VTGEAVDAGVVGNELKRLDGRFRIGVIGIVSSLMGLLDLIAAIFNLMISASRSGGGFASVTTLASSTNSGGTL